MTPAPSPRHQHILFTLGLRLREYAERYRLGIVLPDVDVLFVSGQFLRPDLVFVPESAREGITDRGVELPPGLIVEVLSPTSRSIDRVKKPRRYADFGVPEYWVADPEERVVWVWRFGAGAREPERLADRLEWQPSPGTEPLRLDVADLFRPM